ncbi:MAG TPA: glycosyltransferase family 4 protein, partial [candidate division Zixibacteria bacterium]|nr:glycosyltransferase family 4 protein [candidate division Zixibacteria bacterium]
MKTLTPHIGYVLKRFPRLSETFVLNEMLQLERLGANVTVFAMKPAREAKTHELLSQLRADVVYLDSIDTGNLSDWLSARWSELRERQSELWTRLDRALAQGAAGDIDLALKSAWVAAEAIKRNIQHFHAHFATQASTIAEAAAAIGGRSYSFTAHAKDIFVHSFEETGMRRKINASRALVTVTEYNRRYITECDPEIDARKVRVLYNGIDLERFTPETKRRGGPPVILGLGRLVPKKGFHVLLDACATLRDRGIDFRCVIAGDGEESERLREQRGALDLEGQVDFPGAVTSDEALRLLRDATVVCLPCVVGPDNNIDALPTVLLESLAVGTPAVSTRLSGIPEIIESGVSGFLVEPDNAGELANRLAETLASEQLRDTFAHNGRA